MRTAQVIRVATLAVAISGATFSPGQAQCQGGLCGDFNCTNTITSLDILDVTFALWYCADLICDCDSLYDVDQDGRLSNRDVAFVTQKVFNAGPTPSCLPGMPGVPPPTGGGVFLVHDQVIPAQTALDTIDFELVTTRSLYGLNVAMEVLLDGAPLNLGIDISLIPQGWIGRGQSSCTSPVPDHIYIWGITRALSALPPGRYVMPRLPVTVSAAPFDRTLEVRLFNFDSAYTHPFFYRNSMAVDGQYDIWQLSMGTQECPIALTGDVDMSGQITSSDIIRMVNYVFKSGAIPLPCTPAGDVNCDQVGNSADVIVLVNHVFKGGVPPCDACTVHSAPWGCW